MSERASLESWGRLDRSPRRSVDAAAGAPRAAGGDGTWLPFGNGRSYGDSCHDDAGVLADMRRADRILSFDPATGELEAEAGILLRQITAAVAPHGWFLPVTPGTQFVTLGGAIANDVHGKNHHRRGTFGAHVLSLTIERSDRGLLTLAPDAPLFRATVSGMGLTGLIRSARMRMMRVPSTEIRETTTRFDRLSAYFAMAAEADERHEYAVAWIDSLSRGRSFGRGHLICGDHAPEGERGGVARPPLASIPFAPPVSPLVGPGLRLFNEAYYRKAKKGVSARTVPFDGFFYPLDRVGAWNRLYGPRGLHQHQSAVPEAGADDIVAAMLEAARAKGQGSFLTVLKRFGGARSPGILSFPRPGYTLTLDFPHRGRRTLELLAELDAIAVRAGGAVNPYKDARMSPETFAASFPRWRELEAHRDPAVMSDFWRRTAMRLGPAERVLQAAE